MGPPERMNNKEEPKGGERRRTYRDTTGESGLRGMVVEFGFKVHLIGINIQIGRIGFREGNIKFHLHITSFLWRIFRAHFDRTKPEEHAS